MKKKYYLFIFLLIFILNAKIQYLIFIFIVLIYFFNVIEGKFKIKKIGNGDYIVFAFLVIHIYGIIRGIIVGNELRYIVSNFAGIFVYFTYFIILSLKLEFYKLMKLIYFGIYIYCLFIFLRVVFNIQIFDPILDLKIGSASSGQSRLFCPIIASFGIFIGTAFYYLEKKKMLKFILNLIVPVIMFFFVAASKGFALIFLFFIGFYLLADLRKRNKIKILLLVVILFVFYSILKYFEYDNILMNIFAKDDLSNVTRYEQINFIFKELNILGHGVGATFSNYVRNENAPYAIEIVYLNLFHKYGIFGIVYIYGIVFAFSKLLKQYKSNKNRKTVLELIGIMCYSIAALGNPILFAPTFVTLNCIVLYYINYNKEPWFKNERL